MAGATIESNRQRKYDFRDCMAKRKCTSSVRHRKCYVRLSSEPVVGLPDFSPQRTLRTQRKWGSEAIYDASNAVAQMETVEINDDSELFPAKLKVRDNLCLMNGGERTHGFDLNNDEVFYEQIEPIPCI
jgi:hypothetical protein